MNEKLKQRAKLLVTVVLVILLDQISKNYAQTKWSVVCNKGIAFGIGLPDLFGIVAALIVLVLVLILYLVVREKKTFSVIGLSLIFAGGLSNLVDRLTLGCVRDFIDFKIWPSFNLADSAITLGVAIIMLRIIFGRNTSKNGTR